MKINIKNNSTKNITKVNVVKNFLIFCQSNSPIKNNINIVLVDSSYGDLPQGKIFIPLSDGTIIDILNNVANIWITEFSRQRNIPCKNNEPELLVNFFLRENPLIKNLLYI